MSFNVTSQGLGSVGSQLWEKLQGLVRTPAASLPKAAGQDGPPPATNPGSETVVIRNGPWTQYLVPPKVGASETSAVAMRGVADTGHVVTNGPIDFSLIAINPDKNAWMKIIPWLPKLPLNQREEIDFVVEAKDANRTVVTHITLQAKDGYTLPALADGLALWPYDKFTDRLDFTVTITRNRRADRYAGEVLEKVGAKFGDSSPITKQIRDILPLIRAGLPYAQIIAMIPGIADAVATILKNMPDAKLVTLGGHVNAYDVNQGKIGRLSFSDDLDPSDYPTLDQIAKHIRKQRPDLPPVSEGERDPVVDRLRDLVAKKTGLPQESLALDRDLETELGIDIAAQLDILETAWRVFALPRPDRTLAFDMRLKMYPPSAGSDAMVSERLVQKSDVALTRNQQRAAKAESDVKQRRLDDFPLTGPIQEISPIQALSPKAVRVNAVAKKVAAPEQLPSPLEQGRSDLEKSLSRTDNTYLKACIETAWEARKVRSAGRLNKSQWDDFPFRQGAPAFTVWVTEQKWDGQKLQDIEVKYACYLSGDKIVMINTDSDRRYECDAPNPKKVG